MAGEPDGTLFDWRDIATSHKWDTLLLGNGMSISIWEPFGYRKLYDRAKFGDLSARDRKLFSSTQNFERVLVDLLTAIRVNDAVGLDTKPLLERYRNIQLALVHAVREVHLKLNRVYLSHALERLRGRALPLVVFGSSLSEHDSHLAEALSKNPHRPIAISMLPASKKELLAKQVYISGRLEAISLLFFDATSHPLGDPALAVAGDP
jgi:hypothetical protein